MKHKKLTLSLVIPVFNEEDYLSACLDTIAAQTVKPDEVIVVDNNSTDNTTKIAGEYDFVTLLAEKRQGIVHTRNRGFDNASCDIIGRIDADTRLARDWVEKTKFFFDTDYESSAVTGSCYFYDFPFKRSFHVVHNFIYYVLQDKIAGTHILWGSNMAIRKTVWNEVRSSANLSNKVHEDIDLSLLLHSKELKIERTRQLRAEVSLRHGDLSVRSLRRYLKAWHKTYSDRNLHGRAFFTAFLEFILLFGAVLLSPFRRYIKHSA